MRTSSSSPPRAASSHNISQVELPEPAHDGTISACSVVDIHEEHRIGAAPDAGRAGSFEPQVEPSEGTPSTRSPVAGADDVPNDGSADGTAVPVPQTLLIKLIDTLSELKPAEKLSGWTGVEDHLFKHDSGEMKYYGEDIDTLLVFAGLFSAFLTAFVVQTYPMLTDNDSSTTNQLLALSVSMQLRATGTIIPSTVNSTLTSLMDTQPFSPATSAQAINVLFFLSLVLSLSAALFGILAKQWLREYLRWNSPLALPRENVLVRQARIDAWESWNIPATISFIPALLELAMVLFLCGIVVLLWTLDDVVALIITIFAALFLVTASMFTLLPIAYKRYRVAHMGLWNYIARSAMDKILEGVE
ncbi:hypothetical protein PsYK624_136740 [Phanerochaete sordida]|uniref:DUF6535 domain-containing protein n=1 Tax=Phanerochaete sordida TaxID=48140 RepID=A0A9P3GQ13_9APHY|nr:hypothetical protein PsYK624_136740 [Phanerochaete sordida]